MSDIEDRESREGGEDRSGDAATLERSVRAVRLGSGANCSSIGSVVDTLFVSAAVGGAVFAAVCAALKEEGVRFVGAGPPPSGDETVSEGPSAHAPEADEDPP